jgi:hypothetical protein
MSEKNFCYSTTQNVTYLKLLKVIEITMKRLTQEQVAQKIIWNFQNNRNGLVKVLPKNQELMMPVLPTVIESEKKELR